MAGNPDNGMGAMIELFGKGMEGLAKHGPRWLMKVLLIALATGCGLGGLITWIAIRVFGRG